MKIVSITVLSFLFIFSAFRSWGQNEKIPLNEPDYNKPKVFQNLPDTIPVEASSLASLFSLSKGQKVAPDFSNKSATTGFQLRGEVISKSDDVPANTQARTANPASISSMILKLSDYAGSNFTLSKTTNAEGKTNYTGRIINFKSGDLFVLQNIDGKLMLIKKDYYALVNE